MRKILFLSPADSANISDSIIAELIQAPPPPPPLPEPENTLPPPPALPELIDTTSIDQKLGPSTDMDKKVENRSRSQKSETNSQEINQFSSQSSTHDSNRRESKYSNNQDHRPKKTTSRFSNPTASKIPSLLDLPSENPYGNNEIPSNRSAEPFFHNDDTPTNNMKSGQNRFAQNQPNRFASEQGSQNNKFADGMNFSKDSSFGYRFDDNKSNWNKHDQSNSRYSDEQPFSNQFGGTASGRDNFGNESQDRFGTNKAPNFPNNSNRFSQDQHSNSSTNKFPSNSSQFNRFSQDQTRSNSNSQESFTVGPSSTDPPNNLFPKDQDDRILPNATFQNRFVKDVTKSFTNPFANVPNKSKSDDTSKNFPGNDVKAENDVGRHPQSDNQRFLQNQTPNNFMMTTPPPPPTEQRNLFQNQSMNRFANTTNQDQRPDGFGRVPPRFDDFQNSFPRSTFNIPPMNQPTNFIPNQPNLQQPPPNFQTNNQPTTIVSPFNSSAFGMNFTSPPPVNPLLHTIPQPLPMSLNKIPPPKDLDLNAIPEPKVNLVTTNFSSSTG